ncbi:MAG TPA: N-acyl-D-aspartate/D-glutamate deacylase [Microscillaceae bacterium]|nr:N-acyl-D-aspartate/D-glutamate deacylase [Microscillaceae bacterium]
MSTEKFIIRNGTLYDGTGEKPRQTDVLIENGKVASTDRINYPIEDAKEIDATNKWITPGFLDIHTHYDAEVEVIPGLDESVRHGVTTVVMGNCSLSNCVGTEDDMLNLFSRVENMPPDLLEKWIKGKFTWNSPKEYYDHLNQLPIGPNVASFIGHSNIRLATMGLERSLTVRKANDQELKKMESLVTEAMEAGYLGLSIDMLPFHRMAEDPYKGVSVPSQQAHVSEYKKLANIVRRFNRVLQATPNAVDKTSVLRLLGMSSGLFRKNLRTTIVAALDTKSDRKIHLLATTLATVANKLLNANIRWQALAEPFLNYSDGPITPLFEEFGSAVVAIGASSEERRKMFADISFRKWFKKDWNHWRTSVFHRRLDDMWIEAAPDKSLVGKSFAQAAKEVNKEPLEFFMDMMAQYDTDIRWKSAVANHRPSQRMRLLAHETTLPGFNDSGAHNVNMAFQDGALQTLKQFQANPEVLPMEKIIYRITKMPADWLGFKAGSLLVGDRADLVVLDPAKLQTGLSEPLEYFDPRLDGAMRLVKRSDGVINHVLIGGKEAFSSENGFAENFGKEKYGQQLRSTH